MNPISVEELAQICHLSLTHFRRTFESVMHIGPLYYLNSVRITKACDFLVNTDANILAIAQMAGFSTPSNFHRQFGRMMRITPSEYRRSMRRESSPSIPRTIWNITAGWSRKPTPARKPERISAGFSGGKEPRPWNCTFWEPHTKSPEAAII